MYMYMKTIESIIIKLTVSETMAMSVSMCVPIMFVSMKSFQYIQQQSAKKKWIAQFFVLELQKES